MHSPNYVLFTTADAANVHGNTLQHFEKDLLINLLFEDKLLLPDAYLAISKHLIEHISNRPSGGSLFELAARNGLVVPAYRNAATRNLEEGLKVLKGVYGSLDNLHILQLEDKLTLKRLCTCIDDGGQVLHWPPPNQLSLGESYKKMLHDKLRNESNLKAAMEFTDHKGDHAYLWEQTADWRTTLLDRAEEATVARGQQGIQRIEIFRSLAADLNVKDIYEIGNDARKRRAQAFIRWVNHCHQLNISRAFGVSTYLVDYDFDEDFVAGGSFVQGPGLVCDDMEPLRISILLPKWDLLTKHIEDDPEHFIRLRKGIGSEYFKGLEYWRKTPTYKNREKVAELLQEYARQLCAYYLKRSEPGIITTILANSLESLSMFSANTSFKSLEKMATKIMTKAYKINWALNPNTEQSNICVYHPQSNTIA